MKPPLACQNCRHRKRKCNRGYPTCSQCLRTRLYCSYSRDMSQTASSSYRRQRLEYQFDSDLTRPSLISSALFLDPALLRQPLQYQSPSNLVVGPGLEAHVLDDNAIASHVQAFAQIDNWLPFIPRDCLQRWSEPALVPQFDGQELLLLACLKNLTRMLPDDNPSTKEYLLIKSAFLEAELAGCITVLTLQALVLLLIYEFGHGLYPSAYLTLGACCRYLTLLGIDSREPAPGPDDTRHAWLQSEAKRRLWWAIYVMEVSMALSCPQRPLLMPDLTEDQVIPSDEASWTQQTPYACAYSSHLTLATPAKGDLSNFRLLAHSAYLAGRVIRYAADPPVTEKSESALQLCRTITALMAVLEMESETDIVAVGPPRSLLNSALFALSASEGIGQSEHEATTENEIEAACRSSAASCYHRAMAFMHGELRNLNSHPFMLQWAYKSYGHYYMTYQSETHAHHQKKIEDFAEMFRMLNERWKLANVYSSLLNGQQIAAAN